MNRKKIELVLLLLAMMLTQVFAQQTKEKIAQRREINYYLIEAKEALVHGNMQKAISLYNECLVTDKSCATAHYELANIAAAVKNMEMALKHSRAAVGIAPKNVWYLLQLAEIMETRGMLEQAAETYASLAHLESQNPYYWQKSAMLFETAEKWKETLQIYDTIQKKYGNDFNLLVRKQALYTKSGKIKEGYTELRRLLKSYPDNSEYHALLAMRYEQDGEQKKAEKIYYKIEKLDSISGVAQMMLNRYYMSKEDYLKAYKALQKAIVSGQVDEKANIAAVINLLQKDTTEQAKIYRDTLGGILIKTYPENAIGYLFKAQQYGELEQYEQNKEMLEKALDIDPSSYNGLAQLCVLYNAKKQWDVLYKTATKAIEYYPQEHLFYVFKGLAASQKKEYVIAEASLTTGYLYAKDLTAKEDIQELLADAYYKSGKVQKAFDLFEEILAKNSDNHLILNNYAYFLSLENRQLEKAKEMSQKTVAKEPNNATYLDTYAWILYQKGEYLKALETIQKAIANLDNEKEASSEMWEHYGDILYKLGEKSKAVEEWEKALTLPDPETARLQEKIARNNQ